MSTTSVLQKKLKLTRPGSRYRTLILFVTLFVVAIVGLLATNIYVSSQRNVQAQDINLAGRQLVLSERIAKTLLEINRAQQSGADATESLTELKSAFETFDKTLNAFNVGGTTVGTDGKDIDILPVQIPAGRVAVEQSVGKWESARGALQNLVNADHKLLQTLSDTTRTALAINGPLLTHMKELVSALEGDYSQQARLQKTILIVGIAFALLMFGVIVFYFVRQLKNIDVDLSQAQEETSQILDTVNDGLFLLDRKLVVGHQHSLSLTTIMRQEHFADKNFLAILGEIVSENVLATANDYLNLLFGDRVNENLVAGLNPLEEVEVHFKRDDNEHEVAHLSFSFKRIHVNKKVSHLLVQVDDVTDKVILARELEDSKEQAQEQFGLLVKVLHVEPNLLAHFLSETDYALESINEILQQRAGSVDENRKKVEKIFRTMHSVKGDAAGLELTLFVNKAHEFESMLEDLRDHPQPDGSDFVPLIIKLDEFMRQVEQFKTLIEKLGSLNAAVSQDKPVSKDKVDAEKSKAKPRLLDEAQLMRYATRIAKENGKSVAFIMTGEELIPDPYVSPIKHIMNQLIGNAVIHGIEKPVQRTTAKKSTCGAILATIKQSDESGIELVFRDDGQGVSDVVIREAAVEKGLFTQEEVEALNREETINLVFHAGVSSAKVVDSNAGRGVGMDMVSSTVKELGGKVSIDTSSGAYCEFRIWLPDVAENAVLEKEIA